VVGLVLRRAEELAQLSAELERSNKELEAFSYTVSHDLRAPLRHIAGYVELLNEDQSSTMSPTGRRYLDTVRESAEFAGKLVDNLLQFSKLGRDPLRIVPVDLSQVITRVLKDVEKEVENRSIVWKVGKMPWVRGDGILLQVVIRNLVSNAIKYTRGKDIAEIEIGCKESDRDYVFHVRDNGVGFDMRFAGKLFGVFQRLHRMEDFEGTGIGLANVRRIIGRHGGRTWAESEPGQGASFYFSLPIWESGGGV
jgi:light-regulated signal transduction histidine kinase (bacteriophytochrome)